MYVQAPEEAGRRASDLLDLDLHAVVIVWTWIVGKERVPLGKQPALSTRAESLSGPQSSAFLPLFFQTTQRVVSLKTTPPGEDCY